MKRRFFALLFLAVAVHAKQPEMNRALDQLQASPEAAAKTIDFILANAQRAPALHLFISAAAAQSVGRLQDSAFLFYTAQLRTHFDLKRYPPILRR